MVDEVVIERKVVTALFCDVVGSTEMAERLDPEDVDRLLRSYHRLARQRIEAHGGTVEKFIGDAVVGLFGAPAVHEDDPSRAVRSALALLDEIARSGLDLHVRVGIQTGETVVRLGVGLEEGFATGDALNTAARIQNAAPIDGVAIGDATYRLVQGEFDWEDLGAVSVKGKAEPVQLWRPLRAHERTGGAEESGERTPFVGRDAELAALTGALHRARRERTLQLVTIVADPGMGKSRLVRELRRVLHEADPGATFLRGRCLPYGDGITYWALAEIVKTRAGILESDDPATVGEKLDRSIVAADPDARAWQYGRLAPLVGLPVDTAAPGQDELFAAWSRHLASFATEAPAVLVFEDLHWADAALIAFLSHLVGVVDAGPLLVVVTARPEIADRHPDWLQLAARGTVVQLTSLDGPQIRTLVEGAIAGAAPEFVDAVLDRAGGSPLYAEQLVALAAERQRAGGGDAFDVTQVPPTLQSLLAARIDALPPNLKPALLDASVIGRVFWSGAVANLASGAPDTIEPSLEELARRALTREHTPSSVADEAEYAFWHALLRDVAYSFLSRAARLQKHRAAAAWITDRLGSGAGDLGEIVADHLRRALDLATATGAEEELPAIRSDLADALIAAGSHLLGIEPARAVTHLRAALELLAPDDRRRPGALTNLGHALMARAQYGESATAFEQAVAAHRALGDELTAAELSMTSVRVLWNAGKRDVADSVLATARPILEANPGAGLIDLYFLDASQASRRADLDATEAFADRAIELAQRLGLPRPYRAVAEIGSARLDMGKPGGEALIREAVELAIAAGDRRYAVATIANAAASRPNLIEALAAFDEAIDLAGRYGISDSSARGLRFDTLDIAGRWDEVIAEAPALLAEARTSGDAYAEFMVRTTQAGVLLARGELAEDVSDLRERAVGLGLRPYIPASLTVLAALVRGNHAAAAQAIRDALASVPEGEFLTSIVVHVETAILLGDVALARNLLNRARPALSDGGAAVLSEIAIGMVLEAEGDIAGALARYETAAAFTREHGWGEARAQSLAGIGRCRIALGDVPSGLAALREAREIAVGLKAAPMLTRIDTAIAGAT